MNKTILALVLISIASLPSAEAGRASSSVFGSGDAGLAITKGSLYYNSSGNVFYNPVYVNDFKNYATIEKQTSNQVGTAEGGFFTSLMNFNFGFYLNRGGFQDGATYQNVGNAVGTTTAANMHPFEFFLGSEVNSMESPLKWGVSYSTGSYRVSNVNNGATVPSTPVSTIPLNDQLANDKTLRAGISIMGLEPFLAYKLTGQDTYSRAGNSSNPVINKNKGWTAGTRYRFGEWTPWGFYNYKKLESGDLRGTKTPGSGGYYWDNSGFARSATTDAPDTRLDNFSDPSNPVQKTLAFGLGRTSQATETVKIHYGIGYVQQKTENTSVLDGGGNPLKDVGGNRMSVTTINGVNQDQRRTIVPIQIGVEGDATTFLVLRAGLQYRLIDTVSTSDGIAGTQADATRGRVGATLKFGKLDFDWTVGNNGGVANAENVDAGTFAVDNGLFTMANLTYRW